MFCRLTDEQRDLYKTYLESNVIKDILKGKSHIFVGLINLRKICNHPDIFTGGPCNDGQPQSSKDKYGYYKRSGISQQVQYKTGLVITNSIVYR